MHWFEGLMGIFVIGLVLLGVVLSAQGVLAAVRYNRDAGSYYNMAVDASSAKLKLEHLQTYRNNVERLGLTEGYCGWLLILPQKNMKNQTEILDSIIERLERVSELDEGSFEYQQALYQISRNDLCHRGDDETANCFQEELFARKYVLDYYFWIIGVLNV